MQFHFHTRALTLSPAVPPPHKEYSVTWSSAVSLPHKEYTVSKFSSSAFAHRTICDLKFQSFAQYTMTSISAVPLPQVKTSFEIPHFCFCTRTLLFVSALIQPPTHFLIFVLSYMNDGTSEGQKNKGIGMVLAKVVVNVWLCEALDDDTLCSYWHSSRPIGQAGFALRPRERGSFIMLTQLRQRFWTATVSARRYGLSANTIHNRLRKK